MSSVLAATGSSAPSTLNPWSADTVVIDLGEGQLAVGPLSPALLVPEMTLDLGAANYDPGAVSVEGQSRRSGKGQA
jgi:hypothetical protein